MVTLTVKIPEALASKLEALIRQRGQRKSEIVREAIERMVEEPERREGSVFDLVSDLKGAAGKGPKDLSTNPKYLRGFGE